MIRKTISAVLAVAFLSIGASAQIANDGAPMVPNASSSSGGGPPTGAAGGALSGTYPDPALATAQPSAHTWSATQTFTLPPIFTDQSGSRTALGLGTAATQNTGTSGANIPFLNGTNVWSGFQSLVMGTGTGPDFEVSITGDTTSRVALGINTSNVARVSFGPGNAARDVFLERLGVASLRHGGPDAAAPVAQTISVQNVVAGTSNTVGVDWTFKGSQGTGTGVGGGINFQVAPAGSTGSTQNALANALTIAGTKAVAIPQSLALGGCTIGGNALCATGTGAFSSTVTTTDKFASGGVYAGNTFGFTQFDTDAHAIAGTISGRALNIIYGANPSITMASNYAIGWNSVSGGSGDAGNPANNDLIIRRDAANILAQRNGVNAQKLSVYNTFTDSSNYERGVLDWITTANTLSIGTAAAGTGTVRNISLVGGTVGVANTTDASASSASGALQVAGGASVAKRFWLPAITTSAGLQTAVLCQSSGGEVIADSVACLASSVRFKNLAGPMEGGALAKLAALPLYRWAYKPEGIFHNEAERVGPIAEDVAAMDQRLAGYDNDGKVRTYSTEQLLAYTIKALQELKADNDNLREEMKKRAAR